MKKSNEKVSKESKKNRFQIQSGSAEMTKRFWEQKELMKDAPKSPVLKFDWK